MGRALFSHTYRSAPAVRTEPEPVVDICEKWSAFNRFDPDSDEFFLDAETDEFLSPEQLRQQQGAEVVEQARVMVVLGSSDSSSDSSDGASSDAGSPMATGPDDPAVMIADVYSNSPDEWQRRFLELTSAHTEWRRGPSDTADMYRMTSAVNSSPPRAGSEEATDNPRSYRPNRPRSASAVPAFFPTSSSSTSVLVASDVLPEQAPAPVAPTVAAAVVPVTAPRSRSPSPVRFPAAPSTPQRYTSRGQPPMTTMVSPSPPPSVTPRYYSWQSHAIPAIPTSPTIIRGNRDGPLTNPHARMSFARLGSAQSPVLVQNTAI